MKTYLILQYNNVDLLGSDQLVPVDGRWRYARWYDAAKERRESLAGIGKKVNGFRVVKGDRLLTAKEIYKGILSPYSL